MRMCLTSKYPEAIEFYLSYNNFIKLKCIIAFKLDVKYGEYYFKLMNRIKGESEEDEEEFLRLPSKMLCYGLNFNDDQLDVVSFLWDDLSITEVPYKTCKIIYNLIKDTYYDNLQIRYFEESNHDWEEFKRLLKGCYDTKNNLICTWY